MGLLTRLRPWAAAVAVSAGAFYVSTQLGEFWPAAWVAPAPVLLYALRARRSVAGFAAAGLALFLGSLNLLTYLAGLMPAPVVIAILLAPALAFALIVLAARYADRRLPPWATALVLPAGWTSYEFLSSQVSPHGTAGSLGYSQVDFLPLLQLASVTGLFGVTFVLILIPSAVAVGWHRRALAPLAVAASVLVIVLAYGAFRLQSAPRPERVRVGLAATDRGLRQAFAAEDRTTALAVARAYATRVQRLASEGAQVVVLPEKFLGVTPEYADDVLAVFSRAAHKSQVTLVAGLNEIERRPPRNVAVVFGPDGAVIAQYEKRHMLPGPETGYEVGAEPGVFDAPAARWGVAICKDMDFPGWSRRYGARGVRILAVPAWDFVRDGRFHSRMAVFRAVENGFTMARVAQQGLLTFCDAYGRILAERPSGSAPDVLLACDITPGPGNTMYTRFGDWFGWTSVLVFAALIGRAAYGG